jgi:hypothetical protein
MTIKVLYLTNLLFLRDAKEYAKGHPKALCIEYFKPNGSDRKGYPIMVRKIRFVDTNIEKRGRRIVHEVDSEMIKEVEEII